MNKISFKQVGPILAITVEGNGKIKDFNKDVDKLYEYLYSRGLAAKISGPTIGLFYTEKGGKYVVAIPVKEKFETEGDIKIKLLPPIKCTSLLHEAKIEKIEESFNKLKEYRKRQNLNWIFPVREIYIPFQKETNQYKVEIQVPVK